MNNEEALGNNVKVGEYSYGSPQILQWTEDDRCEIGKFCSIADNVTIFAGGEHRTEWVTTYPIREILRLPGAKRSGHPHSKGPTIIGNDVWIGFGATILSGVIVGDGAVIGASSVVTKDVAPYSIVAGNPARVIRQRFDDTTIEKLLHIAWWNWPIEKIVKHVDLLCSDRIEEYLERFEAESENSEFISESTSSDEAFEHFHFNSNRRASVVDVIGRRKMLEASVNVVTTRGRVVPLNFTLVRHLIAQLWSSLKRVFRDSVKRLS